MDAYGLKGGIKVQPYSQDAQALLTSREWWIGSEGQWQDFEVYSARMHAQSVTSLLVGVADRNAALGLKSRLIAVSRKKFPATEESEYYWVDLVGLQVFNPAGERLGEVRSVLDHSAHPILEVEGEGAPGSEPVFRLIPFVGAIVRDVDLEKGRIEVDWQLDY
jgi:16S rRNA processing protein RimM